MFYEVVFREASFARSAYKGFLDWYEKNRGSICENPTSFVRVRKNSVIVPGKDLALIITEEVVGRMRFRDSRGRYSSNNDCKVKRITSKRKIGELYRNSFEREIL